MQQASTAVRTFLGAVIFCTFLVAALLLVPSVGLAQVKALKTAVIKSTTGLCMKGATCHTDQAGVWIPTTKVGIVSVSVAEQTEVALYVDIEISTKPIMYQCKPTNADGCIFRVKYAGPGLFDYGATAGSTYLGSNITNTNMTFQAGYAIVIDAGVPIYVHLDVRNRSLLDILVDQDAWLYYVPLE